MSLMLTDGAAGGEWRWHCVVIMPRGIQAHGYFGGLNMEIGPMLRTKSALGSQAR
jgi:hypothetical protein